MRFANEWIRRLIRDDPRNVLRMGTAMTAAAKAFKQVMGSEGTEGVSYPTDRQARLEAGFTAEEVDMAVQAAAKPSRESDLGRGPSARPDDRRRLSGRTATSSPGPDPVQAVGRLLPGRPGAHPRRRLAPQRPRAERRVHRRGHEHGPDPAGRLPDPDRARGSRPATRWERSSPSWPGASRRASRGAAGRGGAARGRLLTRGDAALVPDPPVDERRVLGAVTGVARDGGWVAVNAGPRQGYPVRAGHLAAPGCVRRVCCG